MFNVVTFVALQLFCIFRTFIFRTFAQSWNDWLKTFTSPICAQSYSFPKHFFVVTRQKVRKENLKEKERWREKWEERSRRPQYRAVTRRALQLPNLPRKLVNIPELCIFIAFSNLNYILAYFSICLKKTHLGLKIKGFIVQSWFLPARVSLLIVRYDIFSHLRGVSRKQTLF